MERIFALALSATCLIAGLLAISRSNPMMAILWLLILSLGVAGIFAIHGAVFLGLIQLILYVGAVLVLFLFVVSMMNLRRWDLVFPPFKKWRILGVVGIGVVVLLAMKATGGEHVKISAELMTAKAVGKSLYTQLLVPFELVSVLLLAVVISVVWLGRRWREEKY